MTGPSAGSGAVRVPEIHWGREQVLALISSVEEFFEDFYDGTKKKKAIWNAVAEHMREKGYYCLGSDCDKKWRNLKTTYIRVLQKQVHGDTSTRFEYFDALHHILGQEIDPLGMREQAMNQGVPASVVPDSTVPAEFQELTNDEGFLWTSDMVHLLLDYITECLEAFATPDADISAVWEDIALQLSQVGSEVNSEQCQRKWLGLEESLRMHQAQAEATGVLPLWAFYTRTREVANTVNVRTNVQRPRRVRISTQEEPRQPQMSSCKSPRKTCWGKSVLARVKHIESTLTIKKRLERLEARVEASRQQKEATRKTNVLLVQVLAELRRINSALKEEEEPIHGGP
ncbi:hypothetical protein O3P69_017504 [Scylla paramamosain]|uniref:Myb/SANT-like DNA-binding domain-containing protein n=1 Tax=Scylla paramamosain TaxID=85552 RepID=A0AAW0TZC0_SCYPA